MFGSFETAVRKWFQGETLDDTVRCVPKLEASPVLSDYVNTTKLHVQRRGKVTFSDAARRMTDYLERQIDDVAECRRAFTPAQLKRHSVFQVRSTRLGLVASLRWKLSRQWEIALRNARSLRCRFFASTAVAALIKFHGSRKLDGSWPCQATEECVSCKRSFVAALEIRQR